MNYSVNTITQYRGFAKTPPCNTGVFVTTPSPVTSQVQTVSLGWVRMTGRGAQTRSLVKHYLSTTFDDVWNDRGKGVHYYQYSSRSALGMQIWYSEEVEYFTVEIPQSVLDTIDLQNQKDLITVLRQEFELKPTRVDAAVDDYSGCLQLDKIKHALDSGNIRSRLQDYETTDRKRRRLKGFTCYIGNRQSNTFLRFYDKAVEQKMRGKPVENDEWKRLEAELKAEQAELFIDKLIVADLEDWHDIFRQRIRAAVDFVDASADSNKSRCPLLDWWQQFCSDAIKLKLPVPKPVPTIEKVLQWFETSVSSTLATLSKYYGKDEFFQVINLLIDEYSNRLNVKQRFILQRLKPT